MTPLRARAWSAAAAPAAPVQGRPAALLPDRLEPDPRYREALAWIWSFSAAAGPRDPGTQAANEALKLDRVRALLSAVGEPQRTFGSVLVAGTKGKGSTVAMLASCLTQTGVRTGRYTSPHLVNWRERTVVDGQPIAPEEVVSLAAALRRAVERLPARLGHLTTFEVGTVLAFLHFARVGVQAAVVEVGVGGRTDATNVLEPLVSIVTPISYDHTAKLGRTLEAIAWHKAGILRAGRTAVFGPQPQAALRVLRAEAARLGARSLEVGRDWCWRAPRLGSGADQFQVVSGSEGGEPLLVSLPLMGNHQRDNAVAAIAAARQLGREAPSLAVRDQALQCGLADVSWPGRLQVVRAAPLLVLDGAHNGASAAALARAVRDRLSYRRLLLVFGMSDGKDLAGTVAPLLPLADGLFATAARHERAIGPSAIQRVAGRLAPNVPVWRSARIEEALTAALAEAAPDDLVLVTGSLFLVGEALAWHQLGRSDG